MEQEKRTFKNPIRVETFGNTKRVFSVTSDDGIIRHAGDFSANLEDWDVEITFTKKVKPIPDGTLVRYSNLSYYIKRNGTWYYLEHLRGIIDSEKESMYQDDAWFRRNTKPLTTSEWE